MKIRCEHPVDVLPPGPSASLGRLRSRRGFDAAAWITAKCDALDAYLRRCGLSGAVLGVSGGVDSAVAAALLSRLRHNPASVLSEVVLLSLPAYNDAGVTGQVSAQARAQAVATAVGLPLTTVDLAPSLVLLRQGLEQGMKVAADAWSAGQGVAVARTTACYQASSLLTQQGTPGLVVGTINRDEGAYLGYVGKASDGMVDLQLLSDLHKSEVYQVARLLNVPEEVLSATPTGDMFDACPDTAVFGAPYDAVELLLLSRTLLTPDQWADEQATWSARDALIWSSIETNLKQLHAYNAHKYMVRSPAIHLDVMESHVEGGWGESNPRPCVRPTTTVPAMAAPRCLPAGDRRAWVEAPCTPSPAPDAQGLVVRVPRLLSARGVQALTQALSTGPWQAADEQGNWRKGVVVDAPATQPGVGSWRTTFVDAALAQALWESLKSQLPPFRLASPMSRFDPTGFPVWRLAGISPVFRAISYAPGGVLVPHYDAPFEEDERRRTGMSVVIYLDQAQGGDLRFMVDPLASVPYSKCRFDDWDRSPRPDEVAASVSATPGSAVVFDHRLLHDSAPVLAGQKMLLRTNIVFEGVG